jgi:hypothetical protein
MKLLSAAVLVFIICAGPAFPAEELQSLKGLKAMSIAVEHLDSDAESFGLRAKTLRDNFEQKLTARGFTVMSHQEYIEGKTSAYVSIDLNVCPATPISTAFDVQLQLLQECNLTRNPEVRMLSTITWSKQILGHTADPAKIYAAADQLEDAFLNDLVSQNQPIKPLEEAGIIAPATSPKPLQSN